MIGIINYRMGNLQSVKNALDHIGSPSRIIHAPEDFEGCSKLILPGVGAFGQAMKNLSEFSLRSGLDEYVLGKQVPLLGICLGLQLLFESSREGGEHPGLGYIKGAVLPLDEKIKDRPVPHMGWNSADLVSSCDSQLFSDVADGADFYFVHSYYCEAANRSDVAAQANYGFDFDVAVERGNIFGTQFHPEKSHKNGLHLLENFWNLSC